LASAFWQSLLFGNPESLVSSSDATRALQLVLDKLGVPIADDETISTLRAGQLRKLLRERFGSAIAAQTMVALWRAAAASLGVPNIDQSQLTQRPLSDSRPPRWVESLHDPSRIEREWQEDLGIGHP
jgi:hypothetical protein